MARIKGIAIVNLVKYLRARKEAARKRLPSALHTYLEERIRVSEWYPEGDLMALLEAFVSLAPHVTGDPWEWIGRQGFRDDYEACYARMIRRQDPAGTLSRYPFTWRLYHDGGEVDVTIEGEGEARIEIEHALTRVPEFCRLQAGHLAELLEHTGARQVRVQSVRVGDPEGPATWKATWAA